MMSKIAVVYWSGTGNTEAMANEVAEGAKSAGAEAEVFTPDTFSADKMDAYDAVAFGCPAMGGCAPGRRPVRVQVQSWHMNP